VFKIKEIAKKAYKNRVSVYKTRFFLVPARKKIKYEIKKRIQTRTEFNREIKEEDNGMANGRGGARLNAGRKRKPLADKLLDGNPGHEPITRLKTPVKKYAALGTGAATPDKLGAKSTLYGDISPVPFEGGEMPPVAEYLKKMTKNTTENLAPDVFKRTWTWLKERGCDRHVKTELIEQYALYIARWIQCEEGISTFGLLAKHPTTGSPIASPYVAMGLNFLKQANVLWLQIFQIVKENNSVAVTGKSPNDEIFEKLMGGNLR
jgi:hypothetical protein